MSQPTQSGELSGQFPTTRWTMVHSAQSGDPRAISELCRIYWFPLYCFARRMSQRREDALDLTQGFFESLLERQAVNSASMDRGKLRAFLLTSLKNFAAGIHRKNHTIKRGGGIPNIELDALQAEQRYALEPLDSLSPERAFDRAWAKQLLDSVLNSLANSYHLAGKSNVFSLLREHLTDGSTPDYESIASSLGISQASARYAAFKIRERYRSMLREAIVETVTSETEADEEIAYLHSLFSI